MIVVAQHRTNQYYGKSRAHGHGRFGKFGSPNCRSFEYGAGLYQNQSLQSCKRPVIKRAFSGSLSPKTSSRLTSLPVSSVNSYSEEQKKSRNPVRSSSIMIPVNLKVNVESRSEDCLNDEFPFSELWAGPAYSNSPPPSSLPIPKFSLRPKRSVSLELPASASDIDLGSIAKSAPVSPTREGSPFSGIVFDSTDCATQTLRRILNLEITDG